MDPSHDGFKYPPHIDISVLSDFDILESTFLSILDEFSRSGNTYLHIGFDLEWKPKIVYGSMDQTCDCYESDPPAENPVSLMQITLNRCGEKKTYLIRLLNIFDRKLCEMSNYHNCALFRILTNPNVLKYGVGITSDVKKLAHDFIISMRGVVELGELAQNMSAYLTARDSSNMCDGSAISASISLQGIVDRICGIRLPKEKSVQCGNWEAEVLSHEQILYAASDSYYGLLTFEKISEVVQTRLVADGIVDGGKDRALQRMLVGLVDSGGSRTKQSTSYTISGNSSGKSNSIKSGENCLSTPQAPIYESCCILNKHGSFLSYCDQDRLNWYLKKGLAEELDAAAIADCIHRAVVDPLFASGAGRMIVLNFEANGPGNAHDTYRRQMLQNRCVSCGLVDGTKAGGVQLLHHHVVPKAYRKVFPTCMVSKNNHDILPMCKPCKARVALVYAAKMEGIEKQYIDDTDRERLLTELHGNNKSLALRENYSKVKSLCRSLLSPAESYQKKVKIANGDGTKRTVQSVPVSAQKVSEIKQGLLNTLKVFCRDINFSLYALDDGEDVSTFDVRSEVEVLSPHDTSQIETFLKQFEVMTKVARDQDEKRAGGRANCADVIVPKNMETLVVMEIIKPHQLSDDPFLYIPLLHQFEEMWRTFFLAVIQPQYIPDHWRVDYKKIDPRHTPNFTENYHEGK